MFNFFSKKSQSKNKINNYHNDIDSFSDAFSFFKDYSSDFGKDHNELRKVSRCNYNTSRHARAMIQRLKQNTIGTGLKLQSTPVWDLVKPSASNAERQKFTRDIELRFDLWAQSHECDAQNCMNLYELSSFAFVNALQDGEVIIILRYENDIDRMSPLSLQFINPDQIDSYPPAHLSDAVATRGNIIRDGFQVSKTGKEIAIFVKSGSKTVRVPIKGNSRQFVIHPAIRESIGQVRGMSPIAMLADDIKKLTDYSVAEVKAAVNNALIAGYVKPGQDAPSSQPLSGIMKKGISIDDDDSVTKVKHAGMFFQNLKKGEEIKSFDTSRPNVNYGTFVDAVTSYMSASLNIPVEVLRMTFNQNYSASRASLILYWQTVEEWRLFMQSQFLKPIYAAWLQEEINANRILCKGFYDSPVLKNAWLKSEFIGASMPSIDPLKEAKADDGRIAQGALTLSRNAQKYNGSDYYENARQLQDERAVLPSVLTVEESQMKEIQEEDDEKKGG